jgi:hypothetical protein
LVLAEKKNALRTVRGLIRKRVQEAELSGEASAIAMCGRSVTAANRVEDEMSSTPSKPSRKPGYEFSGKCGFVSVAAERHHHRAVSRRAAVQLKCLENDSGSCCVLYLYAPTRAPIEIILMAGRISYGSDVIQWILI